MIFLTNVKLTPKPRLHGDSDPDWLRLHGGKLDSNPDSDHLSRVDCDPDSNPDSGPGARVNVVLVTASYNNDVCMYLLVPSKPVMNI